MIHGVGLLLLSTVAGYWLLERAESHKGELRRLGRFLGTVVIVVSLVGMVCKVWALATYSGGPGMGWFCPYSSPKKSSVK